MWAAKRGAGGKTPREKTVLAKARLSPKALNRSFDITNVKSKS